MVLSIMDLIVSLTLVSIIHQWQKYVYLTTYFIWYVLLMDIFPIFLLSVEIYRLEFKKLRMSRIEWIFLPFSICFIEYTAEYAKINVHYVRFKLRQSKMTTVIAAIKR